VSHEDLSALVAEQAALRRVATVVARGAAPEEVFAAITQEVGRLLLVDCADMSRCEPDGEVTFVAAWGSSAAVFPVGSRWKLEGNNLCSLVVRTGRPARIESYVDASGAIDVALRDGGVRSAVGTPIIVEGRVWGVMAAGSGQQEPLTSDTEARLVQFTELLATAVANAESRAGLARLAEEQAALRRVATLVARSQGSQEVFETIAEEVGRALSAQTANVIRFDPEGMVTIMSGWNAPGHIRFADGGHFPVSASLGTMMLIERRQAIGIDDADPARTFVPEVVARMKTNAVGYLPLFVQGQLWGEVIAAAVDAPVLKPELEGFIGSLLQLVAISIDNAQTQADLSASRSRLVRAADSARRQIERDLHDGAQSRFVSLAVKLQLVQIMLERESDEAAALLQDAAESLPATTSRSIPPTGAITRKNTARLSTRGRRRRYDTIASPTSTGSGNRSTRRPLAISNQQLPDAPVDVIQRDRRDLTGAQPQPRQHRQDRQVPAADHGGPVARVQQRVDLAGLQALGQPRQPPPRDRGHRAGERTLKRAFQMHEAKQRPQRHDRQLRGSSPQPRTHLHKLRASR